MKLTFIILGLKFVLVGFKNIIMSDLSLPSMIYFLGYIILFTILI